MTENRLQVLVTFCGFVLGLITIYGPTWLFLRHEKVTERQDFVHTFPHWKPWLAFYEVIAFVTLLASPVVSIIFSKNIHPWLAPFFVFTFISNSIGIINGVFEAITSICPRRGLYLRRPVKEIYVSPSPVRKIGILRICLGLSFISVAYVIATMYG